MIHPSLWAGWQEISQTAAGSLIAAVWQGTLLAAVAWLGLRLLPKTPPAVRFAIWFGVFLVMAALPLASFWPHAPLAMRPASHSAWLTLDARWCFAIVALWAVVSLVRAVTLAVAAFRVRALWRRALPVELPGSVVAHSRGAKLCVSDEVDRPSVIGFFSPKILIPRWLLEKLTPAELEQIVLHEAGHLGRADDWMNLVQKIALVLFPLNPALLWVERRLCFERELAVDERVLHATGAPKAYAACLATLAEYRLGRRGLALSLGALGRESELGQRVGRILRRDELMRSTHARLVLGGAMLGLAVGAVELARCPQMVAFSAPSTSSTIASGIAHPGQGIGTANGYGVVPVVFHPNAAHAPQGLDSASAHRNTGSAIKMPSAAPARATSPLVRRIRSSEVKYEAPSPVDGTGNDNMVRQWVVVTSWDGANVSRFVLTSASPATLTQKQQALPATADEQLDSQPSQVHPYAAVPVRGGWLVIQL